MVKAVSGMIFMPDLPNSTLRRLLMKQKLVKYFLNINNKYNDLVM